MSDEPTAGDALREDTEMMWGTVHYEAPVRANGHLEVEGWVRTGCFEATDKPVLMLVTSDDGTRDGEPDTESLMPLDRVLKIAHDRSVSELGAEYE